VIELYTIPWKMSTIEYGKYSSRQAIHVFREILLWHEELWIRWMGGVGVAFVNFIDFQNVFV
jgi:hypothetical protein